MARRPRPVIVASAANASHDLGRTEVYTVLSQRFMADALEAPFAASTGGWTEVDLDTVIAAVEVLAHSYECSRSSTRYREAWLMGRDDQHILVTISDDGDWSVQVAAGSEAAAADVVGRFAQAFPVPDFTDATALAVRFWAMGAMGPFSYQRRIEIGPWSETAANYPGRERLELDTLMTMSAPETSGRLILWHGPPGTGKTSALRTLADAWRDWCRVDYIVDADEFFGHAAYMVSALIDGTDNGEWRLVVIEDAGEFLKPNASEVVGQGLARLLNLSDGLVGQGLKLLILITTNEPADSLHAAVTRPGRCLSNIEFGPFSDVEADAWLTAHDRSPAGASLSLAELFATT